MADLYFPQLTSGALAQYPIQKTLITPTVKNILADGSLVLSTTLNSNPHASRLIWQLSYTELSVVDLQALQAHFATCQGPYRAFTFIDPTDNMLACSSDLTAAIWQRGAIQVTPGILDPEGGNQGTLLTNTGQASQQVVQTLKVPANYQYCLSAYVMAAQAGTVILTRNGTAASDSTAVSVGPSWTRVFAGGQLNDAGASITVGITLAPGQQITVYGMQLEAQLQPSRYRVTQFSGGVYSAAHWAVDELIVVADAPNFYSTSFSIETNL